MGVKLQYLPSHLTKCLDLHYRGTPLNLMAEIISKFMALQWDAKGQLTLRTFLWLRLKVKRDLESTFTANGKRQIEVDTFSDPKISS